MPSKGFSVVRKGAHDVAPALLAVIVLLVSEPAHAQGGFAWQWADSANFCDGNCAVAVYGGPYIATSMKKAFGIDGFVPPWNYKFADGELLAVTASRRIGSFGRYVDVEGEVGAAKQFGPLREGEFWAAFYVRWKIFPWNDYIKTTFAVSTGINVATGISPVERHAALDGIGGRSMHYFSPEFTLALPNKPQWEVLVRFHHRSDAFLGPVGHGAQFLTTGVRYTF